MLLNFFNIHIINKMSLIITSSSQGVDETNQIGIAQPQQYKNHMKNSLMIPANSEIAVQSVKINRNPMIDAGANLVGNFWFGERLAKGGLDKSVSYFIPTENKIGTSLAPHDFADQYLNTLKEAYSFHPEINSVGITMSVSTSVGGVFTGFDFNIPQIGAYPSAATIPATVLVNSLGQDARDAVQAGLTDQITFDGTTLTCDSESTRGVYGQLLPQGGEGGPISLHNGSLIYSGLATNQKFTIGLARPMVFDESQEFQLPTEVFKGADGLGIGEASSDYFDYAAQVGDDGKLRLYHSVPAVVSSADRQRTLDAGGAFNIEAGSGWPEHLEMKEIIYYQKANGSFTANNGDNSSWAAAAAPVNWATQSGDICFKGFGENMTISCCGTVLASRVTVNASTKDQVPKPIGQTAWKMYPTVTLWNDNDTIKITDYRSRSENTIWNNQPENSWISRSTTAVHLGNGSAVDSAALMYTGAIPTPKWNNAYHWGQIIDTRDIYQPYIAPDATPAAVVSGGDMRAPRGYKSNVLDGYENIFIVGQTERYMSRAIQQWQPNNAEQLGFAGLSFTPVAGITAVGAGSGALFASAQRPSLMSVHSTFIRVPTFTHETYNFATGNPSKILYQVPRFDNSGTETGALYFQNPDKTYIDLDNAGELRITDLDVHFVRKDETFVTDLTGSSEVVFHIRKK